MVADVHRLSKKLHSSRLRRAYQRFARVNNLPNPRNVSNRAKRLAPRSPQGYCYATTPEPPAPGFHLVGELWLAKELSLYNDVLIFRLLKLMFGDPDFVGCFISTTKSKKRTINVLRGIYVDWSYTFNIAPSLLAEVRSRYGNTRTYLRYWTTESVLPDKSAEAMAAFLQKLEEDCEGNKHLFDEAELQKSDITLSGSANVYGERRSAATDLLALAKRFDAPPEPRVLHFGEDPLPAATGALYLAAGLFLVLSLEALVNILYSALLHDEFKLEHFERITKRGDLDLRLAAMHTFCRGFQGPVFAPAAELMNQLLPVRDFRNHFLHGNVGDEDQVFAFIEDHIMFYYHPAAQFRGIRGERTKKKRLPSSMGNISLESVTRISDLVDQVVEAIRGVMTPSYRTWFDSWLSSSIVKPRPLDE